MLILYWYEFQVSTVGEEIQYNPRLTKDEVLVWLMLNSFISIDYSWLHYQLTVRALLIGEVDCHCFFLKRVSVRFSFWVFFLWQYFSQHFAGNIQIHNGKWVYANYMLSLIYLIFSCSPFLICKTTNNWDKFFHWQI